MWYLSLTGKVIRSHGNTFLFCCDLDSKGSRYLRSVLMDKDTKSQVYTLMYCCDQGPANDLFFTPNKDQTNILISHRQQYKLWPNVASKNMAKQLSTKYFPYTMWPKQYTPKSLIEWFLPKLMKNKQSWATKTTNPK